MILRIFSWIRAYMLVIYLSLVLSGKITTEEFRTIDLWNHSNQQQNISGQELGSIDPGQLVASERNKRYEILNRTVQFAAALKSCEAIVVAAYKVADYVPAFQNDKQSEFWNGTVIPILMRSLHEDVIARSVIIKSCGTVGDLANVIQNVYEILVRSHGSEKAIEIAKKNIIAALHKLDESIARVEELDSNAIKSFAEISEKIFHIIGPEAAKFAELKEVLDDEIRRYLIRQQNLISELGKKKGDFESNYYLIEMTSKHVAQTEDDLRETKKRKDELNKLNDETEKAIQNIPLKIQKIQPGRECTRRGPCRERAYYYQVDNPNRDSQVRYFQNIINSRVERLQMTAKDENAKQIAMKQLEKELAGYKIAYKKAKEELEHSQTSLTKELEEIDGDIEEAMTAKRDVDKNAFEAMKKIGLQGNTLIEALSQVRTFARSLKPGASAYSPFASILNSIKSLVEARDDLLSSDQPSDILLAATLLFEQAEYLSDYTVSAQQILKTTDDYDERAIVQKLEEAQAIK